MSQEVVVAAEKERVESKEGGSRASPGPSVEEAVDDGHWEDVEEEEEEEEEGEGGDDDEEDEEEEKEGLLTHLQDREHQRDQSVRLLETNRLVALMLTVLEVCEETLVAVSTSKTGGVSDEALRSSPLGALLPLVLFSANALFKVGGWVVVTHGLLGQYASLSCSNLPLIFHEP